MSELALQKQLRATTLIEMLQESAFEPEVTQGILYIDDKGEEEWISYRDLWHLARTYGKVFAERGVGPGDRVGVILPTSKAFLGAFWGALYAGAIPFALYPPSLMVDLTEYQEKTGQILSQTKPRAIVTIQPIRPVLENVCQRSTRTALLLPKDFEDVASEGFEPVERRPQDTAFLQFTSGSTSSPRGVVLSNANVMANVDAIIRGSKMSESDVGVSWLPPFHDMGLIGKLLVCARLNVKLVWMSPIRFLRSPLRWLQAITKHGGTLSAAPNFAYSLCVRKIKDKDLKDLDLSTWRLAFNGAEPVDPEVVKKFTEKFSKCGFKAETMFPVYGLAESSLGVTFPEPETPVEFDTVDRELLAEKKIAQVVDPDSPKALTLVCCGKAVPTTKVRIVDEREEDLPERHVGQVLAKGPSICVGYYKREEATQELLAGGWLHTGDLGYLADGKLYITGRIKDMIIIRGRNYLPQDIEVAAQKAEGVRKGRVVAFSVFDKQYSTEYCVVTAEVQAGTDDCETREAIKAEIIQKVQKAVGIRPKEVCLLMGGALPKTSSGKLQRSLTKKFYLEGKLLQRCRQNKWKWMMKLALEWLKHKVFFWKH